MTSRHFLELQDLTKQYQIGEMELPVLQGISLQVQKGEYVALMGSSGSGKSTLMNILGCLDRPTAGKYWLEGEEISRLSSDERSQIRNQKIGFVFQSFNLLRRTSALENVMMPLSYSPKRIMESEVRDRARALLERVGLGDRLDHEPTQLSGGQQQRVAIARSLVNAPSLLLADEPTGNLDSRTTEDMLRLFRELNEQYRITILLVTHEPEVAAHAHRTIRVHDGKILDEGGLSS